MKEKVQEKKNVNQVTEKKDNIKIKRRLMITIILSVIIGTYIIYCFYLLIKDPSDIVVVENGKLYLEESSVGYIIREEYVLKGEDTKSEIIPIKAEGERVSKGMAIFRYYNKDEESLISKINELSTKIDEALASETQRLPGDIKSLEKQIEEKIQLININDISKIKEYKKDINSYTSKKAKIAGESSPSGSYIRQLIEERSKYEKQLNSCAEELVAPASGVVSYRVDELENVLTPSDFSNLSKKLLEELNIKTGQVIATSNNAGKVINNFNCYIATILKSQKAKEANIGDKVNLRFSTQGEIESTIEYIAEENEDEILVVFKINKNVEQLIDYRKVSFDVIWWSESGLKIPNNSIMYENDLAYVIRNREGYLDKILVKILKQNENYTIVSRYELDELKELGIDTTNIKNNISLYDEILLNPRNRKVN